MMGRAALLTFLALAGTNAFAPLTGHPRAQIALWATDQEQAVDISIPYDAAARLAYDQWREQYQKGDFDESRYVKFKANYEAITVANVRAKKVAREKGEEPTLLSLNEYGDFTEAEYKAAQKSGKSATTTGDVLSKAVEAVESQSAASTALGDAATALAEEEEKLAKKLGYDSVEELEVAMDTIEGFAEDGSAIVDGLAREARVRSVYLEWCKENGKEPDEARFPTFFSNFLAMEEYAKESGKEMTLNAYADCTEEEYLTITSAKAEEGQEEEDALAIAEAAKKEEEAAKRKAEAEAKEKAAAEAKAKKEAETKAKQEAAGAPTIEIEERAARQAAQAKAQELLAAETEAAAIAAAREMTRKEAAQIAQRRAIEEKAAEIARQKAKEFEEKQRAVARKQAAAREKAAPKIQASRFNLPDFGSMFQQTPAPAPAKKETAKIEVELPDLGSLFKAPAPVPAKKETPKIDLPDFGSIFKAPAPAPKPSVVAKKPQVAPKPVAKKAVVSTTDPVTEALSSLFGSPKATPAPKVAPQAAPMPTPVPAAKKELFSFFGGAKPKKSEPKPVPAPKRAPAPKEQFSLFGGARPKKPEPKPKPAPARAPASKEPFSFFGGARPKKPEPKPEPAPARAPAPKPALSFFGSPPPAPKPVPKVVPPPAPKPFSFFGSPAPKKAAPAPAPAPAPTPSFSFFGGKPAGSTSAPPKKAPAAKAPVSQARATLAIPKKATSNNFGFAFGGAASKKEAETKDDIPILSQFTQNADGSLTGRVSNSKNYKNGTKITTSPVPRGAKAGQIVKTTSGSKYRLK